MFLLEKSMFYAVPLSAHVANSDSEPAAET